MRSKARITKIDTALRRQRQASGRLLMGYSEDGVDGPLFLDGRLIPADQVLPTDRVVRICYQAADAAQNVVRLRWPEDDAPINQASAQD